ncbi:MAG: autotransporter outer membrane beta-barrel domain-containing protein [Candidatus Doudnabacteria bacterium]
MKKTLLIIFCLLGLLGYSQDEYYRVVDWKFYPENIVQLTDSTYSTDAIPFDYNDQGSIQRIVGNYVVDFVGHRYSVVDSTSTTITVLDIYHTGQAPQTGQIARCYRSVADGKAEYVGSIDYSPLDESAKWKLNGSDNELLWKHAIGKASNGLYRDLDLDAVKLGGTLTEPTIINQDNNALKILNYNRGSVFSENGISYTKIDTAQFLDSTLVTKLYVNKYKLGNDSVLSSGYATNYKLQTKIDGKEPAFTKNTAFNKNFGVLTSQVWGFDSHPTSTVGYGLPDYPTTLPASDVYSWAKASVKPSYTTSEVTEGTNLYYTDARVTANSAVAANTAKVSFPGFGTTPGTVLEGRTFGTAANSAVGDFEVPLTFSTGLSRTGNTITNTITQYTDALARSAISLTTTGSSGTSTYTPSIGVLNVPNYTLSGLGFSDSNYAKLNAANTFTNTGTNSFAGTIQAPTAKLTNLGLGYIPYNKLDASGLGNSPVFTNGTNVGIGTVAPLHKLEVGAVGTSVGPWASIAGNTGIGAASGDKFIYLFNSGTTIKLDAYDYGTSAALSFNLGGNGGDIYMPGIGIWKNTGNVGIGYSTGTEITNNKLAVNGSGYFAGNINSTGYQLAGTSLLLDAHKSGSLGAAGAFYRSTGAGSTPEWVLPSAINLTSFNNDAGFVTSSSVPTVRNDSVQLLSGTSVTLNINHGCNMNLTVSGNTTLTLTNLTPGSYGRIYITNPTPLYTFTFSGYSYLISQRIRKTNYQVTLSALGKYDIFDWYYDGVYVSITGELDVKLN